MGVAIVQFIQALIWPAFIVYALHRYGAAAAEEFRRLLPRIKKAGPTGIEFEVAEQQLEKTPLPSLAEPEKPEVSSAVEMNAVDFVKSTINRDIIKIDVDERQDRLVTALAETRLLFAFERSYRLILGSQIDGLKRLNIRIIAPIDEARGLFDIAKARFPDVYLNFTFENWIGFLIEQGFAELDGTNVRITEIGRDFLRYMIAQRLDENKLG